MIELLKKKWVEWLVSIAIVLITAVLYDHFTVRRETNSSIIKSIDQKADKVYVDQQDQRIEDYINKQDENSMTYIKQHAIESEQANQRTIELIKSMDAKLNILLNRQK